MNKLPVLRMLNGRMTQVELAEKMGVNNTTIVRWEKDMRKMTVGNLVNLCKILNVSPNDLLQEYIEEHEEE